MSVCAFCHKVESGRELLYNELTNSIISSRFTSQAGIRPRLGLDYTPAITKAADHTTGGFFCSKEVKYEAQAISLFISTHLFPAHHL